ncbi:MAG: hypothetical protein Q8M08_02760 [Bacteroidales bacterium]|nr:hypothetical protein [Bacteroidales bacterium]
MKTIKNIIKPTAIIQIIVLILGIQTEVLFAANPLNATPGNNSSICVFCSISDLPTLNDVEFEKFNFFAPNVPAEATFDDEIEVAEISFAPTPPSEANFDDEMPGTEVSLVQATPAIYLFDNDPEFNNIILLEFLSPKIPEIADFKK